MRHAIIVFGHGSDADADSTVCSLPPSPKLPTPRMQSRLCICTCMPCHATVRPSVRRCNVVRNVGCRWVLVHARPCGVLPAECGAERAGRKGGENAKGRVRRPIMITGEDTDTMGERYINQQSGAGATRPAGGVWWASRRGRLARRWTAWAGGGWGSRRWARRRLRGR